MILETDLAKYVYSYCSLKKDSIDPTVLQDIADAFFTRHEISFNGMSQYKNWFFVVFPTIESSLELLEDWSISFFMHGYDAPLIIFEEDLE